MLTPEIIKALRAPLDGRSVGWKIQTNPRDGDEWALVVAYISSREASLWLDQATGGDWSMSFHQPVAIAGPCVSLECRLTVCGVTRCDVGTVQAGSKPTDDATKDLYSDAFKRAAVQFGVGAFLYHFPQVKAKVQKFGNSYYLTRGAQQELAVLTQAILDGKRYPNFSEIKVSGSSFGADGHTELFEDEPAAPPAPQPKPQPAAKPAQAAKREPVEDQSGPFAERIAKARELQRALEACGQPTPSAELTFARESEQAVNAVIKATVARVKAYIEKAGHKLPADKSEWLDALRHAHATITLLHGSDPEGMPSSELMG